MGNEVCKSGCDWNDAVRRHNNQGDGQAQRHRRAASRLAGNAVPGQSDLRRALQDVLLGGSMGLAPRRLEPVSAHQALQGGEARAVSERRGVRATPEGPRRDPVGRHRDPLGGGGDPPLDVDRLPGVGDSEAAVGACRPEGKNVRVPRFRPPAATLTSPATQSRPPPPASATASTATSK